MYGPTRRRSLLVVLTALAVGAGLGGFGLWPLGGKPPRVEGLRATPTITAPDYAPLKSGHDQFRQ